MPAGATETTALAFADGSAGVVAAMPRLEFDDGQVASSGLDAVNARLSCLGARLTSSPKPRLPQHVEELLARGTPTVLSKREQAEVLQCFRMDRDRILSEIVAAGREPHVPGAGNIHPVVAAGRPVIDVVNTMVNGLHVNCASDGVGVDEMVTILRQTKDIHFFLVFPDGACGHLTIPPAPEGHTWLWNFHGLIPHYVFLDPLGMYVHYTIGPTAKQLNFRRGTIPEAALGRIPSPLAKLGSRPFGNEFTVEDGLGGKMVKVASVLLAFAGRLCC